MSTAEATTKEELVTEATVALRLMTLGHAGVGGIGFASIVRECSIVGSMKPTSYYSTKPNLKV